MISVYLDTARSPPSPHFASGLRWHKACLKFLFNLTFSLRFILFLLLAFGFWGITTSIIFFFGRIFMEWNWSHCCSLKSILPYLLVVKFALPYLLVVKFASPYLIVVKFASPYHTDWSFFSQENLWEKLIRKLWSISITSEISSPVHRSNSTIHYLKGCLLPIDLPFTRSNLNSWGWTYDNEWKMWIPFSVLWIHSF